MLMMKIRDVLIGFIVSAVVVGIAVSCGGGGGGSSGPTGPATYTVGGALSGATGTIVLKLNGGSDVSMANGSFTFTTMLANGDTYNVQVVDATDRCTVSNGAGTMTTANVTTVAVACAAPAGEKVVRSARLSGAQENPAVVTSATATGGIVFDPGTNGITGGVTVPSLTPTSVGIFQAPSGNPTGNSAIPAIITLSAAPDGKTFFIPAGTTLTAGQITSLRAGELYFNVITAAQSAGEIRGQINLQGGVLAAVSDMDFAQEVVPPADAATCTGKTTIGQGMVMVDRATRVILISYMTHNVTTANLAHIHTSPTGPGSNGGVIINFTPPGPTLAYPTVAQAQMTPTNIADFQVGYLYFNIHSAMDGCPGGEIRGNITALQ
jgi:hypothetical protein